MREERLIAKVDDGNAREGTETMSKTKRLPHEPRRVLQTYISCSKPPQSSCLEANPQFWDVMEVSRQSKHRKRLHRTKSTSET